MHLRDTRTLLFVNFGSTNASRKFETTPCLYNFYKIARTINDFQDILASFAF